MRLRMTDERERRIDALLDATGENTKSKALDQAAEFYLKMCGNNLAHPTSAFDELMRIAEVQGNVTSEEIAEILHTEELPVYAELEWTVGKQLE